MPRIVAVRLWTRNGLPLLADIEEDESVPYQRTTVGFLPPAERLLAYEQVRRRGAFRPPVGPHEEEAEGIWLENEGPEEEQGE